MNNVVLYIRVSTDEQAKTGYSLRDQKEKLLNFCQKNNLNILEVFEEDYSAKNFDRPAFKNLTRYCQKNKHMVNQILVTKWDRFSRNTSESYSQLKFFENLGITINSIEQPVDYSIPEQGFMAALYLTMPEVENRRRSLNIKDGMRRAFKEGRYVVSPPKGYSMGRDNLKKPILIPNEDAKYIRKAFEMVGTGLYSQKFILQKLSKEGFKTSKSALGRILRNPIYCGEVHIKAYKNEKAQIVEGIHEPLISKLLFQKVQLLIDGSSIQAKVEHKKINEKFPLKGFLKCPKCLNTLTASSSKGRNQYYSYYHCKSPCNTRYKIEDAQEIVSKFLDSITLDDNIQKLISKNLEALLLKQYEEIKPGPKHYEKVAKLEEKLLRVQDLFIEGEFNKDEYSVIKQRIETEKIELNKKLESWEESRKILASYKNGVKKLHNINFQFNRSNIEDKRKLIGSIFPQKLQFENNKVRTTDINPVLLKISKINGAYKELKKKGQTKKLDLSRQVQKAGLEPARTLLFIGF